MKLTIYHNPRCRKSREALQLLEEKNIKFKVVKYLDQNFDKQSLGKVLDIIGKKPSDALRKNEEIWKLNSFPSFLSLVFIHQSCFGNVSGMCR